ncbi:hypothetical protein [Amycolatopsis sp. H20-H5]|uniref:hypothetical protein n=1 Tax=Amycolatopsis sp. H20-H5 TaxID=3046309 RepID=UPI002DB5F30A|nr:hypothetical protein [Amycolatopsis sp. H20-H5]MEC3979894.1 hypothetical protein [Amycolatopsis sp. H20-H5]
MSARVRCAQCGWHQHYPDPRDARRGARFAAIRHRCDTAPPGGQRTTPELPHIPAEACHGDE